MEAQGLPGRGEVREVAGQLHSPAQFPPGHLEEPGDVGLRPAMALERLTVALRRRDVLAAVLPFLVGWIPEAVPPLAARALRAVLTDDRGPYRLPKPCLCLRCQLAHAHLSSLLRTYIVPLHRRKPE